MAVKKVLRTTVLCIEVEKGTDKNGNKLYAKKNFKNVKTDAASDNVYAVAEAIKAVLLQPAEGYYLNDSSVVVNE